MQRMNDNGTVETHGDLLAKTKRHREVAIAAYKAALLLFSHSQHEGHRRERAVIVDACRAACHDLGIVNLDQL